MREAGKKIVSNPFHCLILFPASGAEGQREKEGQPDGERKTLKFENRGRDARLAFSPPTETPASPFALAAGKR